jgi:hypothetical protein
VFVVLSKRQICKPSLVPDRKQNILLTQIGSLLFFPRYNDVNSLVPESKQNKTNYTKGRRRV